MIKRPVDAIAVRKTAMEMMEKLYDILMAEREPGDSLSDLQAQGCKQNTEIDLFLKGSAEKAEQVLKNYEKPVNRAIQDLRITENGILWLLASEEKKQRAFASYRYLTDALELGFGPAFREAVASVPKELLKDGELRFP